MALQNSRKAYDEFLVRSESIHRKKASAERGKVVPAVPRDSERAKYDELLRKAQESGDEVSLKVGRR
jgi:hypothetical protein